MSWSIGIDIGGMSIKIGLVNCEGEIISQERFATPKDVNLAIDQIEKAVKEILSKNHLNINDIKGIGVGCPGAVDRAIGHIIHLPNLEWADLPFAKMIEERLPTKVVLSNDVNVAVLGEAKFGVARSYENCVMLAIGTGLGSGIIINKKLYEGFQSRGAEIGHTTLVLNGLECTCGRRGCAEVYASTTALISQTKEAMKEDRASIMWEYVDGDINAVDGLTAFECSKKKDKTAEKVVERFITYLGECILNVFNVFRPEALIIGGGISAQGSYLIDKLKRYCERYEYGYKKAPITEILAAKLGNDAGIIGAASLIDE